eukprot:scaffold73041_cov54-Phaeocystis_antarctica.AAC.3
MSSRPTCPAFAPPGPPGPPWGSALPAMTPSFTCEAVEALKLKYDGGIDTEPSATKHKRMATPKLQSQSRLG